MQNQEEAHSLLESNEPNEGPVSDLDHFFCKIYDYYLSKGFSAAILSSTCNLLIMAWIMLVPTFLITYIDYPTLFRTNDLAQALEPLTVDRLHPISIIFLSLFLLFWFWQFFQLISEVKEKREIKLFYNQTLHISEDRLQTMDWSEVVDKVIQVPRLCIVKEQLTPLDVVNRIMRKENYLIALFNLNVVPFNLPMPWIRRFPFFTKTLEWSLKSVLNSAVFEKNSIRQELLLPENLEKAARSLQWRFRVLGVAGLLLCPFVLGFLLLYFFFRYGEELRNRPSNTLGARQWSSLARWKTRGYNELQHTLRGRLCASYDAADRYVAQFQSVLLTIQARFLSFVVGSLVAVLIAIAVLDDDILTTSHIDGKSLLWYLGIFGTALAVLRGVIPKENEVAIPKAALDAVVQHTHYKPDTWVGEEHTWKVRDEFCDLYEYKVVIFLRELVSIVFAPFILIFSWGSASCCRDIVQFFMTFTEYVDGVGYMCSCANFDSGFDKHGSSEWGSMTAESQQSTKSMDGKMERSFLDFSAHYPSYQPSEQGQAIKENLNRHMTASLSESVAWMGSMQSSFGGSSGAWSRLGSLVSPRSAQSVDSLSPHELQMLHQWYHESMLLDHPAIK